MEQSAPYHLHLQVFQVQLRASERRFEFVNTLWIFSLRPSPQDLQIFHLWHQRHQLSFVELNIFISTSGNSVDIYFIYKKKRCQNRDFQWCSLHLNPQQIRSVLTMIIIRFRIVKEKYIKVLVFLLVNKISKN